MNTSTPNTALYIKIAGFVIALILLISLAVLVYTRYPWNAPKSISQTDTTDVTNKPFTFDPQNSTYTIDGQSVTLKKGISEVESAPGSATKTITQYFGNEAYGDIDGDDDNDFVYLITQTNGGSGTFYYAVAALREGNTYKITNAFFVGDRIAPQSTEIKEDSKEIHINFAERKKDEPMSAEPSQGAVLLLKVTKDGVLEGLMK